MSQMMSDSDTGALSEDDVQFNAHAIAGAWDAADELPACVAAAMVNQYTGHTVTAADGVESDRDVLFPESGVMVEEKAVGVCARDTAEQYAPAYVTLDREDGRVLALNPGQIFTDHAIPAV